MINNDRKREITSSENLKLNFLQFQRGYIKQKMDQDVLNTGARNSSSFVPLCFSIVRLFSNS